MNHGFLWGAATSAHQVEGNNIHNDWWEWEKKTPGIERSGLAADHYKRYAEDFKLAKELGHNAHRLSIEWSRIEPSPGQWNIQAIYHYRDVLLELKKNNLASFVTLHHFTIPQWLAQRGGWENKNTPFLFSQYARVIAEKMGDLIDFWITINEPMVYATQSYWWRNWPPQKKSLLAMNRVIRHLSYAHKQAYQAIHGYLPEAQVGLAKHMIAYLSSNPMHWDDKLVAQLSKWWFNQRFINVTKGTHDFLGINYYFTAEKRVELTKGKIETVAWHGPKSDLGWAIRPNGLSEVLEEAHTYKIPIYITENGLADAADSRRADFIRSHLRVAEKAQANGVDLRGYLHWSLLDNFEWAEGFKPRFGLVAVDYNTMKRTPRPSAYVYKAIIEQAKLE